jgi:hypothetical protein
MALKAVYERFLSSPTSGVLSPDVSLSYITTTTSITGSEQVIKHLSNQEKAVKKKGDKILSIVETPDTVVLDVETTLEFATGGGAYLPSLDDNFLADRVVTFPTVRLYFLLVQSTGCAVNPLLMTADSYCPLQFAIPDPTGQNLLGPRFALETSRSHRFSWKELAHS